MMITYGIDQTSVALKVTVILCTYNRCHMLHKTLDSLLVQRVPERLAWEILIVDNNSSDQTHAVVDGYMKQCPGRFRYLFEDRQGLSRARNAGIRAANGDVIAFVDDDVIVDPDWLWNLTVNLFDGSWMGAGGRVVPPKEFVPPRWLGWGTHLDLGGALALFDLGDEPRELNRAPYGANMAFRKEAFEKYGTFRVELGRCGSNLISGEDTEFGKRLLMAGERLCYEPSAVVEHPVPNERLRRGYFRKWWFNYGRTRIIERAPRQPILRIPREYLSIVNLVFRFVPRAVMHWLLAKGPRARFFEECQVMATLGEIAENYSAPRERRSSDKKIPSRMVDQDQGSAS